MLLDRHVSETGGRGATVFVLVERARLPSHQHRSASTRRHHHDHRTQVRFASNA